MGREGGRQRWIDSQLTEWEGGLRAPWAVAKGKWKQVDVAGTLNAGGWGLGAGSWRAGKR